MSSPFNMPDEYVQGFFKAGQNLLQALTPCTARPAKLPHQRAARRWRNCR